MDLQAQKKVKKFVVVILVFVTFCAWKEKGRFLGRKLGDEEMLHRASGEISM